MKRDVIPYTTESDWLRERSKDITSTTVGALFDLSPYCTAFELWHRLHNGVEVEHAETDRTAWGKRLQDSIAFGVALDEGWLIRPMQEYVRLPEHRVGSSFDYRDNNLPLVAAEFLLEVKNVDGLIFKQGWIEDPDIGIVAPDHIELQAQHECLVAGVGVCYIAALVGGNRVHVLRREYQPDVGDAILRAAAAFWGGPEPAPDFARDSAFIAKRLYGYSEDGKVVEADEEVAALFREYAGHKALAKVADENADAAKARILMKIGDAERVTHSEFTLSAKMVKAADVAYHREPYRGFRLFPKGAK